MNEASVKNLRASIAESLRHLADRIEEGAGGFHIPLGIVLYDGNTGERIDRILRLDTLAGEVEQAVLPIRAAPNGKIVTRILRFKRFVPVMGVDGHIAELYALDREADSSDDKTGQADMERLNAIRSALASIQRSPEDHSLFQCQLVGLMEGFGAGEDHESVLETLRTLPIEESCVKLMHTLLVNSLKREGVVTLLTAPPISHIMQP